MVNPSDTPSASELPPGAAIAAGGHPAAPVDTRVRLARHWRQTRRVTLWLLALWLLTGFGAVFFARELAGLTVFGWPLSFYLAAQGSSLVYLAIIAAYAWRMRRLDLAWRRAAHGAHEGHAARKAQP
jgi:putative solute:sodium symporter small subunit